MSTLQLINYFITLLLICNPFGALPAVLRLTAGDTAIERRKTVMIASVSVAIILILITWVGTYILAFFGVQIASFQFIGGIVIFMLALSMLKAEDSPMKQTKEETKEAIEKDSVAVTPLAIPLIAGPGAISTIIVNVNSFPNFIDHIWMTAVALAVSLCMAIILFFSTFLKKLLGRVGLNIFTRIGGLIVGAYAIQSIAKAIIGMFPILGS